MAKRSQSLSKTITYMRKKVRNKNWQLGERADSISSIKTKLSVSYKTVKNAVRILNKYNILEDRGRDGIFVIGYPAIRLNTALNTLDDITRIRVNLKAAKILSEGGIFNGRTVTIINRTDNNINILYPITGVEVSFDINVIKETLYSPITVEDILRDNHLRPVYDKQTELKDHLHVILPYLKELNISRGK